MSKEKTPKRIKELEEMLGDAYNEIEELKAEKFIADKEYEELYKARSYDMATPFKDKVGVVIDILNHIKENVNIEPADGSGGILISYKDYISFVFKRRN